MYCPVQVLAMSCPAGLRPRRFLGLTRRAAATSGARDQGQMWTTARCGALLSRRWQPLTATLMSRYRAACQLILASSRQSITWIYCWTLGYNMLLSLSAAHHMLWSLLVITVILW